MKKVLALMLALCGGAQWRRYIQMGAEETYTENNNELTITDYAEGEDKAIEIPGEIDGKSS